MIERASRAFTLLFLVSAVNGAIWETARGVAAIIAIALFLGGAGLMLAALVIAAGRSRRETIDVGGLFLSRAPRELQLALAAQVLIGLGAAAARPFTSLAFGVLAPVFGLGMCGLWGARHGTFPARET